MNVEHWKNMWTATLKTKKKKIFWMHMCIHVSQVHQYRNRTFAALSLHCVSGGNKCTQSTMNSFNHIWQSIVNVTIWKKNWSKNVQNKAERQDRDVFMFLNVTIVAHKFQDQSNSQNTSLGSITLQVIFTKCWSFISLFVLLHSEICSLLDTWANVETSDNK